MLTGIHILLTYTCLYKCDHCFLYCGPGAGGTFTGDQLLNLLDEARQTEAVEKVFFEGGEPFLHYPLLLQGVSMATELKFDTGIVTNAYWATSPADAGLWLRPLKKAGLTSISISEDELHSGDTEPTNSRYAKEAADTLGIDAGIICIEKPTIVPDSQDTSRGDPIVGGDVQFRGRAVDNLTDKLPGRPGSTYTTCPHEDFTDIGRVHVDSFGNVHVCQGISIGNCWKTPLSRIMTEFRVEEHPICGPLTKSGPPELARTHRVEHSAEYVDACHFCFDVRRKLIDRFPEYLTPRQVYGLD